MSRRDEICEAIGRHLREEGESLAVAESLTGGLLSSTFAVASQSSDWYLGAVVSYAKAVKFGVLDVPEGPVVSEDAAVSMARGVAKLLGAPVAVAATGAGGPSPQDGQPPGTVWLAVLAGGALRTRRHSFDGDPGTVCEATIDAAVTLLAEALGLDPARP